MKAILITDLPNSCWYCRCRCVHRDIFYEKRPKACPLKPLPRKNQGKFWHNGIGKENTYVCGWNACIDELLGEEE